MPIIVVKNGSIQEQQILMAQESECGVFTAANWMAKEPEKSDEF